MKFVLAVFFAAVALVSSPVSAQQKPANPDRLLFAVNEGADGLQDASEIFLKYEEFMGMVSKALGKKVLFHLARDFSSLNRGMQNNTYQLVMVRPTNFAALAVRDYSYQLVVVTKGGIAPHFIVRQDSKVKTLRDLRGLRIALPEENAYISLITAAMLRELGMNLKQDTKPIYHRDQAVIGHALEMGLADVGVVASAGNIAVDWEKKGGRTVFKGRAQIVMPIVASSHVSPEDVAKLRNVLLALERTEEGKRLLKNIGSPGFEERRSEELVELLTWLGV